MGDPLAFPSPDRAEQRQIDQPMTGLAPLPGESAMWFSRFLTYRDQGYKRSLRRAVAAERARVRVLETTTGDEKEFSQETAPSEQVLKSVAPSSVPGSWQQAASRFHWQERAANYELALIRKVAEHHAAALQLTYANKFQRILALHDLIETTKTNMNKISVALKIEQQHTVMLLYTKQLRGLLADLRIETQGLDQQELQASIEAHALAERQKQTDQVDRTRKPKG